MARLSHEGYSITNLERQDRNRAAQKLDMELDEIELGVFPHYMLKEIFEQPKVIENTFRGRLNRDAGEVKLGGLSTVEEELKRAGRIILSACGTAWSNCAIAVR